MYNQLSPEALPVHTILIVATVLHVLPAVAWAGFTFALARMGPANIENLFAPQMGAGVIAVLAGAGLWSLTHGRAFGAAEMVLAVGALAAIAALVTQAASVGPAVRKLDDQPQLRRRVAIGQRIAAGLLGIAIICMASARYV
jgi:hypothetical protein